MRIENIFKLALKDLKREKRNIWLCSVGIGIGIWFLTLTLSGIEGIKKEVEREINQIIDYNIITVYPKLPEGEEGSSLDRLTGFINEKELNEIKKLPGVKLAYRPYDIPSSIIEFAGIKLPFVQFEGVPPEIIGPLQRLQIKEGRFLEKENETVLAKKVARIFRKREEKIVGKEILVTPIFEFSLPIEIKGKYEYFPDIKLPPIKLKVVGIIENSDTFSETSSFSPTTNFVHLNLAKRLWEKAVSKLKIPSVVEIYEYLKKQALSESEVSIPDELLWQRAEEKYEEAKSQLLPFGWINVVAEDKDDVKKLTKIFQKKGYEVESAQMMIDETSKIFFVLEAILGFFGVVALFASIFGIINVMYLMVTERKKEIGILKALGAKNRDVYFLFLLEAVIISLAGGIFGIVGAFLSGKIASLILNFVLRGKIGEEGILGLGVPSFSFCIPLKLILIALLIAVIFGVLSALGPARKAACMRPVEVLRNE